MGKSQRTKGAQGEREVIHLLEPVVAAAIEDAEQFLNAALPRDRLGLVRNTWQSAVGGSDIGNLPGLSIEVKRQEQACPNVWWKQAVDQASLPGGGKPILIWRRNREAWKVRMWATLPLPLLPPSLPRVTAPRVCVEVALEDWLPWLRLHLLHTYIQLYRSGQLF